MQLRNLLLCWVMVLTAGCQYDPYTWVYTTKEPKAADLVGKYLPDQRTARYIFEKCKYEKTAIWIELAADGTFECKNIPDCWISNFDGKAGGKFDSGTGTWKINKHQVWWSLALDFRKTEFSRRQYAGGYGTEAMLVGEMPPYKIHLIIGDPDSGTGLEFEKLPILQKTLPK